ncbi:prepilin-type N-terminal cleavage/methylation domain-containing protein [Patescibacteria group bacterium]
MKKFNKGANDGGFTLIELLIVIVIIGILAGVVISVMNPAEQQRKAREAVVRANTDKLCLAMHACAATTTTPEVGCVAFIVGANTVDTIGATAPDDTPIGSTYAIDYGPATTTITVTGSDSAGCDFNCTYNTSDGTATAVAPVVPADCLID